MTGTPSALRPPYGLRYVFLTHSSNINCRVEALLVERRVRLARSHGHRQHPHPAARLHPAAAHQPAAPLPILQQIRLLWLPIRSLLTPALPHPVADRGLLWIMFVAPRIVPTMTHPSFAQVAIPALLPPRRTANPGPCILRSITYPAMRAGTLV